MEIFRYLVYDLCSVALETSKYPVWTSVLFPKSPTLTVTHSLIRLLRVLHPEFCHIFIFYLIDVISHVVSLPIISSVVLVRW